MSDAKNKPAESEPEDSVPKAVINRLSLYLRELQHAVKSGHETTSSSQLGSQLGFSDAQVRKDLAYFGQFGYPGIGYRCDELIEAIRKILGTDRQWRITVVGVGNLGRALLEYKGFSQQGFELVAAFDVNPDHVGSRIEGVDIFHLDRLTEIAKAKNIKLAMIAVPAPRCPASCRSDRGSGHRGRGQLRPRHHRPARPHQPSRRRSVHRA